MKASIHVLHAVEPLDEIMSQGDANAEMVELYHSRVLSRVQHDMENIIADCASGDIRVTPIIEHGYPSDVIRNKTRILAADLIVIGKRGETELDEALFGSVTKHVLYETPCDVLVVNP